MMTSRRLRPIQDSQGRTWNLFPWIALRRVGTVTLTGRGYTEAEAIADLHDDENPINPEYI